MFSYVQCPRVTDGFILDYIEELRQTTGKNYVFYSANYYVELGVYLLSFEEK